MADNIIEAGVVGALANQCPGLPPGRKAAAMQNLAHIDVAQARDDPLIKQGSFQGGGFPPEPAGQKIGAEFIAEGLHADILQKLVACHFIFMEQVHDTEAPVIGVDNPHAIIEEEDHMVMGTGTGAKGTLFKIKLSQVVWPGVFIQDREPPSHAEMHQKAMTVVKVNQDILGPALQAYHPPALQPGGETLGKGKAQAGAAKFHTGNRTPRKDRAKPTHNSFDFGKFRHDY
jgi:hypothetical protein